MTTIEEIAESLAAGRLPKIKPLVERALSEGLSATEILNGGLLAGMDTVGEKFKSGEMYVPEVMLAAKCMQTGTDILKPLLVGNAADSGESGCDVVIGTVKGDRHDIGKNLCRLMLEGRGLRVADLGVNVSAEKFVSEAERLSAKVICCSALLTTTMPEMKRVVEAAAASGLRPKVKIMVGGAPVTQAFCDSIGADFYEPDAARCADRAAEIVGK